MKETYGRCYEIYSFLSYDADYEKFKLCITWPVFRAGARIGIATFGNGSRCQHAPNIKRWRVTRDVSQFSQARLIAEKTAISSNNKPVNIGVEIKLKPGWKTYWRTPGDSGVPPQFLWKGSQNVKSTKVLWPAPHWFKDDYGVSIGYKDRVVFPVEITPVDRSKPVNLNLSFNYAACKEVCVPVRAKLTLKIAPGFAISTLHAGEIVKFIAQVPKS